MKKITFIFLFFLTIVTHAQLQTVTYNVSPATFDETTAVTITINGNSINETTWGVTGNVLYMWAWAFEIDDTTSKGTPLNGTWNVSDEASKFTYNSLTDTYTKTITPSTYFNASGLGKIGFLIKAKDGTGDKKSQDLFAEVGLFSLNLTSPSQNSATIITSGGNLNIIANNTNGIASYNLKSNGVSINTNSSTSNYTYLHTNITTNQSYELEVTQGTTTIVKKFSAVVNPGTIAQALPAGVEEGINYNTTDPTKATLVLDAPGKDFVYVAGSFNNYQPGSNYAMKKDPTTGKFWLELTGLTAGTNNTYQYWVVDATPLSGSPGFVKTADPYSTLVLSPFDDATIPSASYPNMPVYPAGQEREVTVLKTGQTPYNWQVTNFNKPKKEDLIVYEVLIRDFDTNRNFQTLINKIDYFKNLKINAIELMPIMEFEGNESWGYNTAFHLALDKFYGTSDKFKEFVDLCHQNGIAVILDVALNHAFGRNPMVRMWMKDADGDGWGDPSSENPYFNESAMHSYSVGSDFNHSTAVTKNYVKRVIKQWIQQYKIDGFRWDLTKGFTQNCPSNVPGGQDNCTNATQADRVAVLKEYADYSWNLDPTHYTIFEHLGSDSEEQQWANYRINETPSKGVMMWGELTYSYTQLLKGFSADITRMGSDAHGFTAKRLIGYPESHDKERLMYAAMTGGNNSGTSPVLGNLNNSLFRMSAIGATSLLIPGPKMIWHFADLGMNVSIYSCTDGSVNTENDATSGDCKLATKPQPQFANNWLGDASRNKIYTDWARMIALKTSEAVFSGSYTISSSATLTPSIKITNSALDSSKLKDVVILSNFDVSTQNVSPGFPYAGTWYSLMDKTSINVVDVNAPISLPAGNFKIYGNKKSSLPDEIFSIPTNNFTIVSKGENCLNANNGGITISANMAYPYVATLNGKNYDFVNNNLSIADLAPGTYNLSITIVGEVFQQEYTIIIPKGASITAKTALTSKKVSVQIVEGTAPFEIFVNGNKQFVTDSKTFFVDAKSGDLLEVKTSKPCEGIYAKDMIELLGSVSTYPNPTSGSVEIELSTLEKSVCIDLFTLDSKLISKANYPLINGKVKLNLEKEAQGIYLAKIYLDSPIYVKIIKK